MAAGFPRLDRATVSAIVRCFVVVVLWGCAPGYALQPSSPLAAYARQTWVMENGLPQNSAQALLQTRDGFLWVGTEAGLARFDGTGFRVFDRGSRPGLPGNDVRCLLQGTDGALWIGTSEGLARWKEGATREFTTRDGLPGNVIRAMAESADGTLWVWTDLGLARRSGERFAPAKNADAVPRTVLPANESSGAVIFKANIPGALVEATSSSLDLIGEQDGTARTIHLATGRELPGRRIQAVFADREGALWIGTNSGLVRWRQGRLERFPVTDPLAVASILALIEDREGNLWVGTENDGLQILRDQRFQTIGAREGLSSDAATAVVQDSGGMLWVGTQENGLNALRKDDADGRITSIRTLSVGDGLASNVILSLAAAPNGDLWVGTPDGLNRIRGSSVATFTSADGLPDDFIRSLLVDPDGSLWIGTRRGLAHWKMSGSDASDSSREIESYTQANGLGSDLVGAMARDAQGDLWVATLAGLSRLHGGRIDNFTTANGLSSNVITALLPSTDGTLLIGTQDNGWDVWDGRGFFAGIKGEAARTAIHAILDDGAGHLWFATGDGIARCALTSRTSPGSACTNWMEFGTADGLRSRETATNSHPSAWRSRDGHLWFATPKGLVEVDPAHFPINRVPPPVVLERFAVDDVDQPLDGPGASLKIAAGHVHFQFDYAGLSFTAPQKVRYRYKLEGFDHGWTNAGTRRFAYYTNIPPGRYTFRVQAANNDGVWNTVGTALPFELRPHFYQTLWFYAVLLFAIGAAILLLVRGRVRLAEREFRAVLGERNRIAREIHDTLAQGYAGISVQLELLAELLRLRKVDAAVEQLNQTREHVREGLSEARQSIWALRTQDAGETTLPVKLRRMVETAGRDGLVPEFRSFGVYRPLPAGMERELLRVAREAMHNAGKHAEATQLFVQLEYGPETIALEVRDNGRGGATDAAGHFGLTGMKERAAAIGGKLEVISEPGAGTTIRLSAAAPIDSQEQAGIE